MAKNVRFRSTLTASRLTEINCEYGTRYMEGVAYTHRTANLSERS